MTVADLEAPPGVAHAMAWEERVQRAAHPVVYPFLRRVARRGPVVRVPGVGVVVSDAARAREVLLDTESFTKTGPGSPADLWTPVLGPAVLLNMEGADHARLRGRLSGLFTPRAVADLTGPVVAPVAEALAERLGAGEEVDVVTEIGRVAGAVICRTTGLDATDDQVRAAFEDAKDVVGMVRLHRRRLTPRQVARARDVLGRLSAQAATAYRGGDEATVPGRMRALGLTEDEALGAVGAFVLTGTETLVSFVPRLLALLADTGWDRRLADGADAGRVVSEALRITAPTPAMLRSVAAPARVGDVAVHPGDRVVVATLLCCRGAGPFDPDVPQPAAVRQLWFGAGPHFCLGMPLAMAETTAFLDAAVAAVRRRGPLRVVGRRPARGVLIPAYERLVVAAT